MIYNALIKYTRYTKFITESNEIGVKIFILKDFKLKKNLFFNLFYWDIQIGKVLQTVFQLLIVFLKFIICR
jgi:hypothetical protein